MGTNIFKVNKKKTEENLKRIPLVDTVTLKRKLPHRMVIEIKETFPQLVIPYLSGYVVTNDKGKVIETVDNAEGQELTLINGIELTEAKTCNEIKAKDGVVWDVAKDCIGVLINKDNLSMFKSLDFSNVSNIFGYTKDNVKVIFGKSSDMEYKLSVLNVVISQIEKTETTYIDLTTPSSAFVGREEEKTEENAISDEAEDKKEEEEADEGKKADDKANKGQKDKKDDNKKEKDSTEAKTSPSESVKEKYDSNAAETGEKKSAE